MFFECFVPTSLVSLCIRAMIPCGHFHWSLLSSFPKPLTSLLTCSLFPFLSPKVLNNPVLGVSYIDTCPHILAFLRQKIVYFSPVPNEVGPFWSHSPPTFLNLSLNLESLIQQGWLVSEHEGSVCLPPRHTATLGFFTWAMRSQTEILEPVWQALSQLSHVPSPRRSLCEVT